MHKRKNKKILDYEFLPENVREMIIQNQRMREEYKNFEKSQHQ